MGLFIGLVSTVVIYLLRGKKLNYAIIIKCYYVVAFVSQVFINK